MLRTEMRVMLARRQDPPGAIGARRVDPVVDYDWNGCAPHKSKARLGLRDYKNGEYYLFAFGLSRHRAWEVGQSPQGSPKRPRISKTARGHGRICAPTKTLGPPATNAPAKDML